MKIVLFDIDGTLLVTNGAGGSAMRAALVEEFGIDQPAAVDFAGRTDRGIMADFFRHHGVDDTEHNLERFIAAYLARLPAALAALQGSVLPGVESLIDQLRERGIPGIGLLTGNLQLGARAKLAHFGLEQHFLFGGFGDRHAERDDVAREALRAAEVHLLLPIEPSNVFVVGDTVRDIQCARAIGAWAVAVATGSHSRQSLAEQEPDLLVSDLTDPSLLAMLD